MEFLPKQNTGDLYLADFNPRFFGQMQFDVSRGLNLPMFVFMGAEGNRSAMDNEAEKKETQIEGAPTKYSNLWYLKLLLFCQVLSGRFRTLDLRNWLQWSKADLVQPIHDPEDLGPWFSDIRRVLWNLVIHPRSTLKSLFS